MNFSRLKNEIYKHLTNSLNQYDIEELGRLNMHQLIKCELYNLGKNLGYKPFPEMRVILYKGERKSYSHRRFDMVWLSKTEPAISFEVGHWYYDEDTKMAMAFLGANTLIHIASTIDFRTKKNIIEILDMKGEF